MRFVAVCGCGVRCNTHTQNPPSREAENARTEEVADGVEEETVSGVPESKSRALDTIRFRTFARDR